jgi:hypothetical protein
MIVKEDRTSLYWVYRMFSNNFLGEIVKTSDSYGDKVNAYAVKADGSTNVMLVNKDVVTHSPSLNLGSKVSQLTLPPWSLTVVIIPDDGSEIKTQTYGAKEMGIKINPSLGYE